jgi:hypothetical protein
LKIWENACERSNVEGTIPRDLRHKAITDMKKAGFSDTYVSHVTAQSDPRTIKRYTHFSVKETISPLQSLVSKK